MSIGRHAAPEAAILTRATEARVITRAARAWLADWDAYLRALLDGDGDRDAGVDLLGRARALIEELARG